MRKDIWINKNLDNYFQCPHCGKGFLQLEDYKEIQTPQSKREDEEIRQDGMGAASNVQFYYFWAYLKCNKCYELVLCAGDSSDSIYFEGKDEEPSKLELMSPKLFMPALDIISIPTMTPQIIQEEIKKSFELFWLNESSCANSIRKVLEYLMDEQNIPRKGTDKNGKEYRLDLHNRLEKFKKLDSKLLIAVKYIGNEGTHSQTTTNYVLDGYELLEYSLESIYSDKHAKYLNAADKIINEFKNK